jgi:hypothetical protein
VDAGYGFAVRSEVGKQFMLWLDTDDNGANFFRVPIAPTCALNLYLLAADLWHSSNGMPAYLRRVLLTRWVGLARWYASSTPTPSGCAGCSSALGAHHTTPPHHTTQLCHESYPPPPSRATLTLDGSEDSKISL